MCKFGARRSDLRKSLQTDRQTDGPLTDDGRRAIALAQSSNELITKSLAIAGRPCDAKACQRLLKWTWK